MFSTLSKGILKKPKQVQPLFRPFESTEVQQVPPVQSQINLRQADFHQQTDGQQQRQMTQNLSSSVSTQSSVPRNAPLITTIPRMGSLNLEKATKIGEDPSGIVTPSQNQVQNNLQTRLTDMGPKLLAIGGGKGGIGKSFISANLAVALANEGYSVALVDLDFGAANLHTCLGIPCPKVSLFDFVSSQVEGLEEIAVPTGTKNLVLYGGGQEFWQQVRPQSIQKIRLIAKLQKLKADYVILDLGAGTHINTLDFFIYAHAGLVVVLPEPTSIENVYVFLKSVLFRKIQNVLKAMKQEEITEHLVEALGDPKVTTPPLVLLNEFAKQNKEVGEQILRLVGMSQLGVVMNQVRTKTDIDIGASIAQISQKYFGFSSHFLGSTPYDDAAWKSVRNRKPLQADFDSSPVFLGIQALSKQISDVFLPISNSVEQKRFY